MKFFVLLFWVLPVFAFGQNSKTDPANPEGLPEKKFNIKVQRIAPGEIKLPFSAIEIMDNRFDTTKLGFIPVYQIIYDKKRVGRKIYIKNGIARGIENYYNEYYANAFRPNGFKLLIVLKKFWVAGVDPGTNKIMDIVNNVDADRFLHCKLEYYLHKDSNYLPIKRVDTVLYISEELAADINQNFDERKRKNFKFILKGLIEIFDFEKYVLAFDKANKKNLSEIDRYNKLYFNMQILKDTAINKGVYFTFAEFMNNKPSVILYKEKKMKYGLVDNEYYLEDSSGNIISDYWGYCDGTTMRINKYGNNKLFRKNNTFEFFIKHKYTQTRNNITFQKNIKEAEVWIPYQIDMDTGKIY